MQRPDLFNKAEQLEREFIKTQQAIKAVYDSKQDYIKIEKIPYTHVRARAFGKSISKTTRFRYEPRFDQKRFDNDLKSAEQQMAQALQALQTELYPIAQQIANTKYRVVQKQRVNANLTVQKQQQNINLTKKEADLQDKINNLNESQRAGVMCIAIANDDKTLIASVERKGYWLEIAVASSVQSNNMQAFDYFCLQDVMFDSLISKDATLASFIIKNTNQVMTNKMLQNTKDLSVTTLISCHNNDFDTLNVLLAHDQDALKKINNVEALSFGAVQLAICNNNLQLLEFIKEHDLECFNEKVVGYNSYFDMALYYNDPAIIKSITTISNAAAETLSFLEENKMEKLRAALKNVDFTQEEIKSFFKVAIDKDCQDIAAEILEYINDPKGIAVEALKTENEKIIRELMSLKPDIFNFRYAKELLKEFEKDKNATDYLNKLIESETKDYNAYCLNKTNM